MIAAARQRLNRWDLAFQLLLVVTLFNVVDFLTTMTIIAEQGMLAEFNIMVLALMEYMDTVWAILIFKLIMIGYALTLLYFFYKPEKHKAVIPALKIVLVPYVLVCFWNYYWVLT